MNTPSGPPYSREFLINCRNDFIKQQEQIALNNFVTTVTNKVIAAAQQGLTNYTVEQSYVPTDIKQAVDALKVNFPDITIKIVHLPTSQKLQSVSSILISWR
jgi:hypothetical protein